MVKSRPEVSPHYRISVGVVEKPRFGDSGKGKRRRMTGPGFFDTSVQADAEVARTPVSESVKIIPELKLPRHVTFKKGTNIYAFIRAPETGEILIPGVGQEAGELFAEKLEFETSLKIDSKEGLEMGKNGKRVIKRVGKSEHGAFAVVNFQKKDKEGNIVTVKGLASLTDRALPKDNEALRFKRANQ